MSNTYSTRSTFDIARNDAKGITCLGLWYRHGATEYVVMSDHSQPSKRFATQAEALNYFEEITA